MIAGECCRICNRGLFGTRSSGIWRVRFNRASQACCYICEGMSSCTVVESVPLKHGAVFQKGDHLIYYCSGFIKRGIFTVGVLFDAVA